MEKLNKPNDIEKYLSFGNLTKPFLEKEYILEKIEMDYNAKIKQGRNVTLLDCLIAWIKHNIKTEREDKEFIRANKFQRTAKEIWESGRATGCTDYATIFCTLARQLGYSCALLHTAEHNWLQKLKNGERLDYHTGHSFCECYYNNHWVLVDPTCNEITENYNPQKLELNYLVGDSSTFVPYFRGLDLCQKQTLRQHNDTMDEMCKNL